ncbi:NVEALA domain-containing protein [Bacteroides bouchesdurhonensis]|uniref:NVEALA domain-containing protein n=1 Tax=Bacteroides bouchesdurhonensis TaxID=1841855 RepID=UPI00291C502A|nr:NVEALA domain-containing protein [Bacteroides bouchesdurhonensis]
MTIIIDEMAFFFKKSVGPKWSDFFFGVLFFVFYFCLIINFIDNNMKKLITFIFLLCVVAILTTKKLHKEKMSPLLLNNIEAIASDEGSSITRCNGVGSIDCPINNYKVEYVYGGYSLEVQ